MKILSIELYLYKRLFLNQTEFFRLTATESIQLILGTNGSGKSSILQELTPLPANHQDFLSDGYKTITIEHNGNEYILKSVFIGAQKHYFLKNGEELNAGNTVTVQRDLVRQEFNITPEIHALMISEEGFHRMSSADRRYWFTKLSDVDYTYAISLYLKLKDKYRDVSGALKIAKKRLVTESSAMISKDDQDKIQNEVSRLYEFLNHLIELRKPIEKPIDNLAQRSRIIEQDLIKLSQSIFKKKLTLKDINEFDSLDAMTARVVTYQNSSEVEKVLINNYITDFNKLDEISKQMKLTEDTNILGLVNKIKDLQSNINELYSKQKLKLHIEDYDTASTAFDTVYDILNTVFISLPVNKEKKYSKQNLIEITEFILKYKDKINKYTSDLNKLHSQKDSQEHQRDHDKLECPKCQHKWSRGYDEHVYQSICLKIEQLQEELDEASIVLTEKEILLTEIKEYFLIYRDFTNTIQHWPVLKPLWDYIFNTSDVMDQPRNILNVIEMFKYDLTLGSEQAKLMKEVEKNNQLISICENTTLEDISDISERIDNLEKLINTSTEKTSFYNKEINKLLSYKKDIEFILDVETKIKILLDEHDVNATNQKETYRRTAFNDVVKAVQYNLSQKEQILSEIKIQKALIKDLENQIEVMETDSESYKLLVKELSPTDGLIAQGLLGFIKIFVKQMNNFIKKIWMYPLEIIPCGITDNVSVELDYKFPLMVQTKANIVSDVSKGSSAMRRIVDLAFKIVSMKYLGLSDFPIILDEPASGMDNEHKISSMTAIKNLMETQDFTQLFLVSHDHAQYGSLTNAEICIMCSNNIVPPAGSVFNRHVIMS
jgi:energy-coupling factor transporter ATP-binding protein EcfA2